MMMFLIDYLFFCMMIVFWNIGLKYLYLKDDTINTIISPKLIILIQFLLALMYPMLSSEKEALYIFLLYLTLTIPLFFIKMNISYKIMMFISNFSNVILSELVASFIMTIYLWITNSDILVLSELTKTNMIFKIIFFIFFLGIYAMIISLLVRYFSTTNIKDIIKELMLINLFIIIVINNLNIIFVATSDTFVSSSLIYFVVGLTSVFLLNFIIKKMIEKNNENIKNEYKISLLKQQIEDLKSMENNYKNIRKTYHDINNHYLLILHLFTDNDTSKLLDYLEKVEKKYLKKED